MSPGKVASSCDYQLELDKYRAVGSWGRRFRGKIEGRRKHGALKVANRAAFFSLRLVGT